MAPRSVSKSLCDERVGGIKKDLSAIETKIDTIMTNDLPHINNKLAVLEERSKSKKPLYTIIASLITVISTIIMGFLQLVS